MKTETFKNIIIDNRERLGVCGACKKEILTNLEEII
jgi:hypothetical protein